MTSAMYSIPRIFIITTAHLHPIFRNKRCMRWGICFYLLHSKYPDSSAELPGPVAYCKYTGLNLFSHTPIPYKILSDNQAVCASNQLLCFFYRWVDCVL